MTRSRDLDACAAAPASLGATRVQAPGCPRLPAKEGNDCTHVHCHRSAARVPPDARRSIGNGAAIITNVCATKLPEHSQLAEINPASDTGQRWWHRQHSWVRRSEGGFNPDLYEVHPISDTIAKSYVEQMHYSGSYVAASRRYGMFIHTEDGPTSSASRCSPFPRRQRY